MEKKPLYRKVNTTAHGAHQNLAPYYQYQRNAKVVAGTEDKDRASMHAPQRRGLDYTPLFKFLLSRVGGRWDEIFSEAVGRLDRPDPIFWMVALHEHEREESVALGQSSFYSGLFVDSDGLLKKVNPDFRAEHMKRYCRCCTHTFNGVVYGQNAVFD
ncbi:hypothetical protein [Pseudomonas purpurea]|uniref:hypothetical protein n=1 Tax=Pseudomonas purpurea TaxID=3136737 RepID=UPI003266F0D1